MDARARAAGVPARFWLWFAGLWFVPGLVFRVAVALGLQEESVGDRLVALAVGAGGDLLALFLVLGFLGCGFLLGARFARWWFGVTLAAVAIILITDCFYWLEFQSRFDRFVLHYAEYPREVLVFLDDQFFVGMFVLPFAVLVGVVARWAIRWLPERITWRDRAVCAVWMLLGTLVLLYGSPGVAGHSRHLHHLGSNGYLGALMAARVDETVLDGFYWQPDPADPEVASLLAVADQAYSPAQSSDAVGDPSMSATGDRGCLSHSTVLECDEAGNRCKKSEAICVQALPPPGSFRHVVLIIEESLGGEYWRNPEKRAQYMPRLMALAAEGVVFESVYATGGFTIRGLEALLNGYPPLPGVVVTTEPRLERLPSLPRELGRVGFRTTFVYGGWPGFTSFHDYWRRIGYHEMLDRFDFEDRWFETSWGGRR